jgi:hypothetical protein
MIESMVRVAGYRTGLYTSPHLLDFRERLVAACPGRLRALPDQLRGLGLGVAVRRVLDGLCALGFDFQALALSPLLGPAGNREFFLWLARGGERLPLAENEIEIAIERTLDEAYNLE